MTAVLNLPTAALLTLSCLRKRRSTLLFCWAHCAAERPGRASGASVAASADCLPKENECNQREHDMRRHSGGDVLNGALPRSPRRRGAARSTCAASLLHRASPATGQRYRSPIALALLLLVPPPHGRGGHGAEARDDAVSGCHQHSLSRGGAR